MPTPSRTSLEEIVEAGRRIVETDGLDGLTMQGVAGIVGVRAPSLYKHVGSRGDLVRLIVEAVVNELGEALEGAVTGEDPIVDLKALGHAFRAFALAHPASYRLVFAPLPEEGVPDPEVLTGATEAVLRTTAALAGEGNALEAARLITAWAHGFVSMELAGAFRMEGDLDEAFDFALGALADALSSG